MEIRRLRADEGMELRAIRLRALLDAPAAFTTTYAAAKARPDSFWHEWAVAAAAGNARCTFVALENGEWQGMLSAIVSDDGGGAAELIQLWVAPGARGGTLGDELIGAVRRWAESSGLAQLQLWVHDGNVPATRLFTRTGFGFTGERRESEPPERVSLQMCRPLHERAEPERNPACDHS